jgi:hypothetical protein
MVILTNHFLTNDVLTNGKTHFYYTFVVKAKVVFFNTQKFFWKFIVIINKLFLRIKNLWIIGVFKKESNRQSKSKTSLTLSFNSLKNFSLLTIKLTDQMVKVRIIYSTLLTGLETKNETIIFIRKKLSPKQTLGICREKNVYKCKNSAVKYFLDKHLFHSY